MLLNVHGNVCQRIFREKPIFKQSAINLLVKSLTMKYVHLQEGERMRKLDMIHVIIIEIANKNRATMYKMLAVF